jgi:hypothetical protein
MPRLSRFAQSFALALCLPATAAFADLTAAGVWADWKAYVTDSGHRVNASEQTESGALTVTDLSVQIDLDDGADQGALDMTLPTLRFVENGDGSVSVEFPDTMGIDLSMVPDSGESMSASIRVTLADPVMTATGDPGDVTYDFAAAKTDVVMNNLTIDGVTLSDDIARASMSLENLAYITRSVLGTLRSVDQTATASAVTYQINFTDPDGAESFKLNGNIRDLAFAGSGALPPETTSQDVNAMLDDGFELDGTFTTQGGGYDMTFDGNDGSGTVNTTSQGADFSISFGPDGAGYSAAQRGVTVNMLLTELPLPLSFAAAEMATNILLPVQQSEQEQDFSLGVALTGFAISDTIWGMFDPAGQLPRDPADLVIDLSGTAKVLFDILDPAQAEILDLTDTVPGELNTLTLNTLEVGAAGARLTGKGDFLFDNGDMVTFDGMPRPEGTLDLTLEGGNGLLDTLVGMGLLPPDQAMGARMMMGMFAVPGEGADTLTSRIEINPEGQVLANGQRLR